MLLYTWISCFRTLQIFFFFFPWDLLKFLLRQQLDTYFHSPLIFRTKREVKEFQAQRELHRVIFFFRLSQKMEICKAYAGRSR